MKPLAHYIRPLVYSLLSLLIVAQSTIAGANPQIAESDSPREALKKSIYAFHNVNSLRVRMHTISIGFEKEPIDDTSVMEKAEPDRAHVIGKNVEEIVIGEQIYQKRGDGPWKRFPEPSDGGRMMKLTIAPSSAEEEIKEIEKQDVKLVGRETVDGVSTLVYQYSQNSSDGSMSATTKKWIAEADALPRRIDYMVEEGAKKLTLSWTYYDFNADIKIEPPELAESAAPSLDRIPVGDPKGMGVGLGTGAGPGHGYNMGGGQRSPDRNAVATVVDQKPVPLNSPQPRYTKEARDNKIQGIVLMKLLVGTDGTVKQAKILRGLPDGLDEQAIQAAWQVHFRPAMKDGQPVSFWVTMQIEFNLK